FAADAERARERVERKREDRQSGRLIRVVVALEVPEVSRVSGVAVDPRGPRVERPNLRVMRALIPAGEHHDGTSTDRQVDDRDAEEVPGTREHGLPQVRCKSWVTFRSSRSAARRRPAGAVPARAALARERRSQRATEPKRVGPRTVPPASRRPPFWRST